MTWSLLFGTLLYRQILENWLNIFGRWGFELHLTDMIRSSQIQLEMNTCPYINSKSNRKSADHHIMYAHIFQSGYIVTCHHNCSVGNYKKTTRNFQLTNWPSGYEKVESTNKTNVIYSAIIKGKWEKLKPFHESADEIDGKHNEGCWNVRMLCHLSLNTPHEMFDHNNSSGGSSSTIPGCH